MAITQQDTSAEHQDLPGELGSSADNAAGDKLGPVRLVVGVGMADGPHEKRFAELVELVRCGISDPRERHRVQCLARYHQRMAVMTPDERRELWRQKWHRNREKQLASHARWCASAKGIAWREKRRASVIAKMKQADALLACYGLGWIEWAKNAARWGHREWVASGRPKDWRAWCLQKVSQWFYRQHSSRESRGTQDAIVPNTWTQSLSRMEQNRFRQWQMQGMSAWERKAMSLVRGWNAELKRPKEKALDPQNAS